MFLKSGSRMTIRTAIILKTMHVSSPFCASVLLITKGDPQLKIDETVISDDIKIAESFSAYFASIGVKLASEIENNSLDSSSSENVIPRSDIQFKFFDLQLHKL